MNQVRLLSFICLLGIILTDLGRCDESHRSPVALAVSSDRSVCLSANQTAGSVSLVHLESAKVLDEIPVGRGPLIRRR